MLNKLESGSYTLDGTSYKYKIIDSCFEEFILSSSTLWIDIIPAVIELYQSKNLPVAINVARMICNKSNPDIGPAAHKKLWDRRTSHSAQWAIIEKYYHCIGKHVQRLHEEYSLSERS